MINKLMTTDERYDLIKKVVEPFGLNWYFEYTKTDEKAINFCRSFVICFLYKITSSSLINKEFNFYRLPDYKVDKILRMDLCDLADSAMIDLNHYLTYVKRYEDENSIYFELDKLNDDYLDIMKIPEFNSKKYIVKKIEHIAELLPTLEKRIHKKLTTTLEVDFDADSYYSSKRMVIGNQMDSNYPLDKFWKYITPVATDDAILAKFEKEMFLEKIKDVRIGILNSIKELEYFLELDCLDIFLTDEEIQKIKDFQKFFQDFNEKHCELFGTSKLGYGEVRRNKRW